MSHLLRLSLLVLFFWLGMVGVLYFDGPPVFVLLFALAAFGPLVALLAEIGDWLEETLRLNGYAPDDND